MEIKEIIKTGYYFTFGVVTCFGLFLIIGTIAMLFFKPIDDSDKSKLHRSGFKIKTDYQTRLQYISDGGCLTPRLDINGNQIKANE